MPGFSRLLGVTAAALMISGALGDCYMHYPPGSNDRNRERNENRNNDERLCDTQNNAKGGYPWCGDRTLVSDSGGYYFYTGSIMTVEWTVQHSCGPTNSSNAFCNVILQALCDDIGAELTGDLVRNPRLIRDGWPSETSTNAGANGNNNADANNAGYYKAWFWSNGQNQDGTNTIPCPTTPATGINCDAPNFTGDMNTNSAAWANFYDSNQTDSNDANCNGHGGRGNTENTCYIPVEFGYHESFEYYLQFGLKTVRNMGLYTADQNLQGNSAIYTRQNPNGNRHGFEIPEERDYFPWWNPSPWTDLAVFVSDKAWCNYFQSNSETVTPRQFCSMSETQRQASPHQRVPIDPATCTANGGVWNTSYVSWQNFNPTYSTVTAPDCQLHRISRDNHLGNTMSIDSAGNAVGTYPEAQRYAFTVPAWMANKECIMRIRYNMSSADYPMVTAFTNGRIFNNSYNCPATTVTSASGDVDDQTYSDSAQCYNSMTMGHYPLYNRPSIKVDANTNINLAIAFNTNQVGRTFQDRSYLLKFYTAPASATGSNIYNLNFRGRRGNIVQCYPAVENDFVPNKLAIRAQDYVHIQFCGSDFNPQNNPNDGEGWQFSTRTNMIEARSTTYDMVTYAGMQFNMPRTWTTQTLFGDYATFKRMAFVDQDPTKCQDYTGKNNNNQNNAYDNCNKLNMAAAHFDGGLIQFNASSTPYYYMSTRNNNFSNRSMKGVLSVTNTSSILTATQALGVALGCMAAFGIVGFFGARAYAKRNPNSKIAATYDKLATSGQNTWTHLKGADTAATNL